MSGARILLAGILGGVAMFLWTSIAHIATPLGEVGFKEIPNEQAVMASMTMAIGPSEGLYIFPGMGVPPDASRDQKRAAMNNYQQLLDKYPSGIMVYKPAGQKAMTMGQLSREFSFEVLEALLLAVLVWMSALRTFGSRIGFAVVVGLLAAITTNLSYWNWYGFPSNYTIATMFVEVMKYVAAGTVVAFIAGGEKSKVSGAAA